MGPQQEVRGTNIEEDFGRGRPRSGGAGGGRSERGVRDDRGRVRPVPVRRSRRLGGWASGGGVKQLDDLWPRCDFLTLHTPMTAETRNIRDQRRRIGADGADGAGSSARQGRADRRGRACSRPTPARSPGRPSMSSTERRRPIIRWWYPSVLVTPHLGARRAQVSVAVELPDTLTDFLNRGQVKFAVNMPSLDRAELEDLKLYLNLAWRLGMPHAMDRSTLKNASLVIAARSPTRTPGSSRPHSRPATVESALEEQVNLVNAMAMARERDRHRGTRRSTLPGDATLVGRGDHRAQDPHHRRNILFGEQFTRLIRLGSHHGWMPTSTAPAGLHPGPSRARGSARPAR